MDELKIGSMLAQRAEMVQYGGMLSLGAKSEELLDENIRRKMEADAKARNEKQIKMRRAAMVVDLAQALALRGASATPAEFFEQAEAFITAAEKYMAENGE